RRGAGARRRAAAGGAAEPGHGRAVPADRPGRGSPGAAAGPPRTADRQPDGGPPAGRWAGTPRAVPAGAATRRTADPRGGRRSRDGGGAVSDPRGFLQISRRIAPYRPVAERLGDHRDLAGPVPAALAVKQAGRCMGCGVPFCHSGCPLGNLVPDWNELVRLGGWREAADALHATNNFPELTGKLCPAPCEEACVLSLNDDPVTIKQIELAIAERALAEGWAEPRPADHASG